MLAAPRHVKDKDSHADRLTQLCLSMTGTGSRHWFSNAVSQPLVAVFQKIQEKKQSRAQTGQMP